MGILNVTPDSFSDGGHFRDPGAALAQAQQMIADGAAIIDVGGESTRPYSQPVDTEEELRRVLPVIARLRNESEIPISIDTSKSLVARAAMDAGADIINDVSGLEADPEMVAVARQTQAGVCVMHMRGTPQTMQDDPHYTHVVDEIYDYLLQRRDALIEAGLDAESLCLDPGIGFGKTDEHNLELLGQCHRIHALGCPLLIGHSRKGFIGKRMGSTEIGDRDVGTAVISVHLMQQRIQVLRVHNVGLVRRVLALMQAIPGVLPP